MKDCANTGEPLSPGDASEIDKVREVLRLMGEGKSPSAAYAEVFGEVLYEAPASPTPKETHE